MTIETGFQAYSIHKSGASIWNDDAYNYKKIALAGISGAATGTIGATTQSATTILNISRNTYFYGGNALVAGVSSVWNRKFDNKNMSQLMVVESFLTGCCSGIIGAFLGDITDKILGGTTFMKNLDDRILSSEPRMLFITDLDVSVYSEIVRIGNRKLYEKFLKEVNIVQLAVNLFVSGLLKQPLDLCDSLLNSFIKKLLSVASQSMCEVLE